MSSRSHQTPSFREKVLAIVRGIPVGKTMTYGEVAREAGNAGAARAVGAILHTNYDPGVPCHRVVRSNGELGGYNRGMQTKRTLLACEGVVVHS